jgi:cell division protein FtsB
MHQLQKWIVNKYIIATALFIAMLFFSDKNSVMDQVKLYGQYNKVKAEHQYYTQEIERAKKEYNELFSNDKNLEKFAREKYLMKRDDEDVYVIIENVAPIANEAPQTAQ